jgi:valacyclovir hydrolase
MLSELGHHPAHLVGFSDGGEVALLVAALAPNMARSLVTWGATGFVSDPGGQLRASLRDIIDNPIPPMKGWSESLIATYGADNARAMMGSFLGAITEIIEDGGDISRSRANAISCPVLLIAGEHDVFAPPALVDELAARIAEAVVTVVPGVGHAVHDERPEWFRDTVLDWLAKPA